MQSAPFRDDEADPDGVWTLIRRHGSPDNEVAACVPYTLVLARADDLAVAIEGFRVYSTGVALDLRVLLRRTPRDHDLYDAFFDGRQNPPGTFQLGVEFADGRCAASGAPWTGLLPAPDEVLLSLIGGRSGNREIRVEYFLSPLPPAGPLTLRARSDELGIAETSTTIDATVLLAAQPRVAELWPRDPTERA